MAFSGAVSVSKLMEVQRLAPSAETDPIIGDSFATDSVFRESKVPEVLEDAVLVLVAGGPYSVFARFKSPFKAPPDELVL
mmetsp:Transcript_10206/g.16326  ORF Transcript_10206/g.16326 Transcript_10206/m.16326 type:complete len:80 (+) Transcript_10206:2857-3096(+)